MSADETQRSAEKAAHRILHRFGGEEVVCTCGAYFRTDYVSLGTNRPQTATARWAEHHRAHVAEVLAALMPVEKAEAALADLRAKVEALAAKWSGCWCGPQMAYDHDPRVQDCPQHGDGAAEHYSSGIHADLRALLDGA